MVTAKEFGLIFKILKQQLSGSAVKSPKIKESGD